MKRAGWIAIVFACLASFATAQTIPEPLDYKQDHYRRPVPDSLTGGTVVNTDAAFGLWKTGRVGFVDVLPQAPKPANLPKGTIWRDKPRASIPGAIWLPNVGYGRIADVTGDYFKAGLAHITGGDMGAPVVFFCLEECWMSWNAARRALEYGYSNVFWYPQGTDGWDFYDHPLEQVKPFVH